MKARTKPHQVDAVQWRGNNEQELITFFGPNATFVWEKNEVFVHSREWGYLPMKTGWWAVLTPLLGVSTMSDAAFLSAYEPLYDEEVA